VTSRRKERIEKSAGGVVVRPVGGVPHVLVIRDPYQNWGLPKGHVENGEAPGDAALREVAEETGLGDLVLGPPIGDIDWYFRASGRLVHKFCAFFLMTSETGEAVPEAAEGITECIWIPLAGAEEQITYENARGIVRKAREIVENGAGKSP
jgi:8-oxo-dGTP pyrophosphatase MutT (NUDIX family)